jgi:hypothetical protein
MLLLRSGDGLLSMVKNTRAWACGLCFLKSNLSCSSWAHYGSLCWGTAMSHSCSSRGCRVPNTSVIESKYCALPASSLRVHSLYYSLWVMHLYCYASAACASTSAVDCPSEMWPRRDSTSFTQVKSLLGREGQYVSEVLPPCHALCAQMPAQPIVCCPRGLALTWRCLGWARWEQRPREHLFAGIWRRP